MRKLAAYFGLVVSISMAASLLNAQSPDSKGSRGTQTGDQTTTITPPRQPSEDLSVAPQRKPERKPETQAERVSPIVEHLHASMILDYATFLVAAITAVFAIFVSFIGIFEWRKVEALKREVAAERKDLVAERKDFGEERKALEARIETSKAELQEQKQLLRVELDEGKKALDSRIETMRAELRAQEQRVHASHRFLEAVLSHHSNLLVEIVRGFGSALNADEVTRLNSLITETESALNLFRPDKTMVRRALLNLEHIGSGASVPSLVQLRDDPDEEKDICIRAQKVLMKVKERIRDAHSQRPSARTS